MTTRSPDRGRSRPPPGRETGARPPGKRAASPYLVPFSNVAMALAVVFLGERLTWQHWVAGGLIVSGTIVLAYV